MGRTRLLAAIFGGVAVIALIAGAVVVLRNQSTPSEPGRWPPAERTAFIDALSCADTLPGLMISRMMRKTLGGSDGICGAADGAGAHGRP